jgi:hypothetical protein
VQLDLYTQIILSVLSVYQSANKSILISHISETNPVHSVPQFRASIPGSSLWIPRFKFREVHVGYRTDRAAVVEALLLKHQSSHTTQLTAIAPHVRIIWGLVQ